MPDPGTQPANDPWSPPAEDAETFISEGKLSDEAPQGQQPKQAPAGSSQDTPASDLERGDSASSKNSMPKPRRPKRRGNGGRRAGSSSLSTADDVEAHAASPGEEDQPDTTGHEGLSSRRQQAFKKVQNTLVDYFRKTREDDDTYGTLELEDVGRWLVQHHDNTLIRKMRKPTSFRKKIYRVSFVELQRMHLRKLQIKLVKHAVDMYHTRNETETWEADLAAYIQAMKDYGYIIQCSKQRRDYFLATGERDVDRFITDSVIRQTVGDPENLTLLEEQEQELLPSQPWDEGRPIGDTRDKTSLQELLDRSFMGVVGAAMLLGPMWIMVLVKGHYTGLITTTVCVAAFGLVAVFWLERPTDVLSVTAAYAAVLVVFVGLNT